MFQLRDCYARNSVDRVSTPRLRRFIYVDFVVASCSSIKKTNTQTSDSIWK